jgi:type IV pilus assembly protein PilE
MSMALPVKPDCMGSRCCRGFTLLEVMIVCALVAIMLTFAVPTYQSYLRRVHRGIAIEVLLAAVSCQERIYARDFGYDTNRCLPRADKDDKYAFGFEPENDATASLFSVKAEPLGTQADDPCGSLMLDQSGARSITGPVERLRKCWEGR